MSRVHVVVEKNIKNVAEIFDTKQRTGSVSTAIILFFSALALVFPFTHIHLFGISALLAFIPFFMILEKVRHPLRACAVGFVFHFIFFAIVIWWLRYVSFWGMFFVFAVCATYSAIATCATWILFFRNTQYSVINLIEMIFVIPSVFVVCEWLRTNMPVIGFGWALLGYTQTMDQFVLPLAQLAGVWGLSAFVVLINVLGYVFVSKRTTPIAKRFAVGVALCSVVFVMVFYSATRSAQKKYEAQRAEHKIRVSVVQPNVPQEQKWIRELKPLIIEKTMKLVEIVAYQRPQIIILPESAYPGVLSWEITGSYLEQVSKKIHVPIVVGAPHIESRERSYNSAYVVNEGEILHFYNKMVLVPFGEFVPFKGFFSFVGLDKVAYSLGVGDFSVGTEYTVFQHPYLPIRFSTLICFEDTIPRLSRMFVAHGADFLINMTNDAWFGDTMEPFQHAQASRIRAVENGVWMVRAANTGVSCFIDPWGQIHDPVQDENGRQTFVMGSSTSEIAIGQKSTIYQKYGYYTPFIFIIILIIFSIKKLYLSIKNMNKKQ